MNAIQYFEWGMDDKGIPFCTIRIKNFFNNPNSNKFIFDSPPTMFSLITYSAQGSDEGHQYKRTPEVRREGNDFVWNMYIKKKFIRDRRNLQGISFSYANEGSVYNIYQNTRFSADIYVSGRKIKRNLGAPQVGYFERNIGDNIGRGIEEFLIFEDNNEAITLSSLLGKEIVFELI